jgi:hypothetical protein
MKLALLPDHAEEAAVSFREMATAFLVFFSTLEGETALSSS